MLRSWGLKFSGKDREAVDYLLELNYCCITNGIRERDLLRAIPTTMSDSARRWFWTNRRDFATWKDFKQAFKRRFVKELGDQEVRSELTAPTQARGEKIANYLLFFKHPPPLAEQLRLAVTNLLPEYQDFLEGRCVESFPNIEKLGQRLERRQERRNTYQPPSAIEKTRIPGGAYEGTPRSYRAAAVKMAARVEDSEATSSEDSTKVRKKTKNVKKAKKTTKKKEVAAVKENAELRARILVEARRPPEAPEPRPNTGRSYAELLRPGGQPPLRPQQGRWQDEIPRLPTGNGFASSRGNYNAKLSWSPNFR